jgi:hypothetical protein
MKYVYYGQTFAALNKFSDRLMQQDEFIAKYGKPNSNGFVKIDDQLYNVYMMDHTLQETMIFATAFRSAFLSRGFTEI